MHVSSSKGGWIRDCGVEEGGVEEKGKKKEVEEENKIKRMMRSKGEKKEEAEKKN